VARPQVTAMVGTYTAICPVAVCRPSLAVMRYVEPTTASNGTVIAAVKSPDASASAWTRGLPSSQLSVISAVDHPCPDTLNGLPGDAKPPTTVGTVGVGCGEAVGTGVGG